MPRPTIVVSLSVELHKALRIEAQARTCTIADLLRSAAAEKIRYGAFDTDKPPTPPLVASRAATLIAHPCGVCGVDNQNVTGEAPWRCHEHAGISDAGIATFKKGLE